MNRYAPILACALCLLVAGCKGKYATGAASQKEMQQATAAVQAYLDKVGKLPETERANAPAWASNVQSVRVLNVERMGPKLKALVEIKATGETSTRYFLLDKEGEGFRVTGVL